MSSSASPAGIPAGQAPEELGLGGDLEGDGFAEFRRQQFERLGPRHGDRSGQVVVRAPQCRVGEHAQPGFGRVAMVDQGDAAAAGEAGPCRDACTSGAAASSDNWKIAGRIVEYGTAIEEANWSML